MSDSRLNDNAPWFLWFTRNCLQLESIDPQTEGKKSYEPMYSENIGYKGVLENLNMRLPTLSLLNAWNRLPESNSKKSALRPIAEEKLADFCQWFLFRKDSVEWFEDFVEHANTLDGWFDACEKSLPNRVDVCEKLIAPKGYFFFNPYKNTGLSQIADRYIDSLFDPIFRSHCSNEQKFRLKKAKTLLEREDFKNRTTHRGIGTMIMIEAGLGRPEKLIPLAEKSQAMCGKDNYNFIAAGNLLYLHGKGVEAQQAFARQDIDYLDGQRLAFFGLFAFLWNDPRLPQIWDKIERELTIDHLESASIGFTAILSFSAKKIGLTKSGDFLWNDAITKKPRLKGLASVPSKIPAKVSKTTSTLKSIARWVEHIESKIQSEN